MPRSFGDHIDSPRRFGRRLAVTRNARGLSQRQLAFPGCTAAYISRLEAGERTPSLQMVVKLADRLNVPSYWFAKGKHQTEDRFERTLREIMKGKMNILDVYEMVEFVLAGGEPEDTFNEPLVKS